MAFFHPFAPAHFKLYYIYVILLQYIKDPDQNHSCDSWGLSLSYVYSKQLACVSKHGDYLRIQRWHVQVFRDGVENGAVGFRDP